jgi:O-glycosyl hydrolase
MTGKLSCGLRPAVRRRPIRKVRLVLEELEPRTLLSATVLIDNGLAHQVINGWGTELTKEYEPGASQIATITGIVYGQLHLNLGQAGQLLEAPVPDFTRTANSDPDPFTINWDGFQGWQEQDLHDNWINAPTSVQGPEGQFLTAKQLGYTNYFLGSSFPNIRWENPWLDGIRRTNPATYRDTLARELLVYYQFYQNNYGEVPPLFQFGNEELTGNHAIYAGGTQDAYPGGPTQEMVDLIKTCGQRLADNGFGSVKFIVGSEETEAASLSLATAILADSQARQYVGAIGYHEYPYGSEYSSLARVLQDSGTGNPPADGVQVRNSLRNLGQQYGVPVWLTEVSHGNVGGTTPVQGNTFDALRARAIDIHDNLVYANMSSFIFQGAYWDTVLQQNHFGTTLTLAQLQAEDGDAFVVLGNPTTDQWQLTMGAYSLGHYSRWVKPGDVRVDANSDNSLVQVTAFRDDAGGTDSFVLINNSNQAQEVTLNLTGATFLDSLSGEQSTASALWSPLSGITPTDSTHVTLTLPAQSVTSLSAPVGADANDFGFETPAVGTGPSAYQYNPSGSPWTFTSLSGVAGNGSDFTSGNPNAPQGTQVAFLHYDGSITQPVTFAAGTYDLSFSAAQRANFQASRQTFQVQIDGAVVAICTPAGASYATYHTTGFTVTAGPHTVSFVGLDPDGQDNTAFIDQVHINRAQVMPVNGGGFETPALGSGPTAYQYNPTGSPWTFTGTSGVSGNGSLFTDGNPDAPEGSQVAFLQDYGSISQVTNFAAGTYVLSFLAAQRANGNDSSQTFQVEIDGIVVGVFTPVDINYSPYTTSSFTVTAGHHTIRFVGLDPDGQENTVLIDEVSLIQ